MHTIEGLALILVIGVGAQWLAWKLKLPAIVFLLVLGFIAGPVTNLLNTKEILGEMIQPITSLSVAIILFEGGLSLKLGELGEIGSVFFRLVTLGAAFTFTAMTCFLYYVLDFNLAISSMLGAILVVTGPTVIGPLLRQIRPSSRVRNIAKWEGIIIDPIGALLAVIVLEVILIGDSGAFGVHVILALAKTMLSGVVIGFVWAWILGFCMKRYLIPDYLQGPVSMTMVIAAFVTSNMIQHESGLFTVTLMGIYLANLSSINIHHITEFKENLGVIIISWLFIMLSAQLDLSVLSFINLNTILFVLFLLIVVRPIAVMLSSIGSNLEWKERLFLSWLAPRGIVAAAISSIFAYKLAAAGIAQNEYLTPITFLVIIGTVSIYGLTAPIVARYLKVADANPQGILIVGCHDWACVMARSLESLGLKVLMIDVNPDKVRQARISGHQAVLGNISHDSIVDELDLNGIGRVLALTANDEANSLAILNLVSILGRANVYQLPPEGFAGGQKASHLQGRILFEKNAQFQWLNIKFRSGAKIKSKVIKADDLAPSHKTGALPLFIWQDEKQLHIHTTVASNIKPNIGDIYFYLDWDL